MHLFYTPDIAIKLELSEEESMHCVRVLRLTEGAEIGLIDGKGTFYRAIITIAHQKRCAVEIVEAIPQPKHWIGTIHVALAPTKNMDRIEWFAEKSTEIGIDAITFLQCRYSERKELKMERIQKILISAMKQSLKAQLPELTGMIDFKKFVTQPFVGQKFIAHCYAGDERKTLKQLYIEGQPAVVLIGPEGDFSPEEVQLALDNGFRPISLGNSRLRTETAALVACHTLQVLNL